MNGTENAKTKIAELERKAEKVQWELDAITDKAAAEQRDMTQAEQRSYRHKLDTLSEIAARLEGQQAILKRAAVGLSPEPPTHAEMFPAVEPRAIGGAAAATAQPGVRFPAAARGELAYEATYRPDVMRVEHGFLRDVYVARTEADPAARERLARNREEALAHWGGDYRDMANAATTGGEFVPPLYAGNLWVMPGTGGRPLFDELPKYPMPTTGTSISIPAIDSGVSVEPRADLGAVSDTDAVTSNVASEVNELAGQVDVGRILVMRSEPGFDAVVGRMLQKRYDQRIETQILTGSGSPPNHEGLLTLSGTNSVTFTAGTPTAAGFLPKVYEAINKVYDERAGEVKPDLIVMHPRRAGWLASQTITGTPVLQQGSLMQAFGTQDEGFLQSFAGLKVVISPAVPTNGNPGTNEDVVLVLASEDFLVSEGPMYVRTWDDVGSANGVIRFQLFAFSAALFRRYPKSCSIIRGTGLTTPAWT